MRLSFKLFFHIFKFDVSDFGLRITWQVFSSFSWILVALFESSSTILTENNWMKDSGSWKWEKARAASSFAWHHSDVIFIEWMAASNVLVWLGRQLFLLEKFLLLALYAASLLSMELRAAPSQSSSLETLAGSAFPPIVGKGYTFPPIVVCPHSLFRSDSQWASLYHVLFRLRVQCDDTAEHVFCF